MTQNKKTIDVISVGSWTIYDHMFKVERLPRPGDTVTTTNNDQTVSTYYYGGCAPNNVVAASKLGAKTALISVVGKDFTSGGYRDYLTRLGVDISGVIEIDEEISGFSFLFSDKNGNAICISRLGASAQQNRFLPDSHVLASAKVVVLNYQFDSFSIKAASIAHQQGGIVIASGNLATSPKYMQEIINHVDYLICNTFELEQILESLNLKDIKELTQSKLNGLLVTKGKQGCSVFSGNEVVDLPAITSRQVKDPVGAGDSFVGGFATGLAFDYPVVEAARLGTSVASFVVEEIGCQTNLPSIEQAHDRLIND